MVGMAENTHQLLLTMTCNNGFLSQAMKKIKTLLTQMVELQILFRSSREETDDAIEMGSL